MGHAISKDLWKNPWLISQESCVRNDAAALQHFGLDLFLKALSVIAAAQLFMCDIRISHVLYGTHVFSVRNRPRAER